MQDSTRVSIGQGELSLGKWIALPIVVLSSWLIFCIAAAVDCQQQGNSLMLIMFIGLGMLPLVLTRIAAGTRDRWWPLLHRRLEEHTRRLDELPIEQVGFWISLAAGTGLYFELVLIRYHGTCFAIFGFFKNLSLLSCFLGLGLGYALGRSRLVLTPIVLPLMAIQVIAMHLLEYTDVALTMQNPFSEQALMGMDRVKGVDHLVLIYAILIWAFALNALCLMPLGQLASHLMGRSAKLPAYSWNLAGSIAAVVLFWVLSYFWSPPVVWFAAGVIALLPFPRGILLVPIAAATVMVGLVGTSFSLDSYNLYSPYQILTVRPATPDTPTQIMVNHLFFQSILDFSPQGPRLIGDRQALEFYYGLPYRFKRFPQDVLVVGAGSGNDVASALRHGAVHVDAVEIDPLILQLGQRLHPEEPYSSERVTAHVQDARAFFRSTHKKYDLIVYGLLDSHTALSGMSGVRLDSYIYTVEALRQARNCLKNGGVLCLSFAVNTVPQAVKLSLMLERAFDGQRPRVLIAPTGGTVFVIGGDPQVLWAPLSDNTRDFTDYFAKIPVKVDPSTDDWPFFYMPARAYPLTYLVMIAMLMATAALFIWPVLKMEGGRPTISTPCFLLGAGFMLLETKAVTELALFYGSTWIVISIVILAILIMAFGANLTVMRYPRIPRGISYSLLLISLGASLWFSMVSGSLQGEWLSHIVPTAVLTLPLFFSGLIFSAELETAPSVSAAMGSNLIGAMLGGCLEYNSMYFGYRSLYVLAMAIYGMSMVVSLSRRTQVRGACAVKGSE